MIKDQDVPSHVVGHCPSCAMPMHLQTNGTCQPTCECNKDPVELNIPTIGANVITGLTSPVLSDQSIFQPPHVLWQDSVKTEADLSTDADEGDACFVEETGDVFIYQNNSWRLQPNDDPHIHPEKLEPDKFLLDTIDALAEENKELEARLEELEAK